MKLIHGVTIKGRQNDGLCDWAQETYEEPHEQLPQAPPTDGFADADTDPECVNRLVLFNVCFAFFAL